MYSILDRRELQRHATLLCIRRLREWAGNILQTVTLLNQVHLPKMQSWQRNSGTSVWTLQIPNNLLQYTLHILAVLSNLGVHDSVSSTSVGLTKQALIIFVIRVSFVQVVKAKIHIWVQWLGLLSVEFKNLVTINSLQDMSRSCFGLIGSSTTT